MTSLISVSDPFWFNVVGVVGFVLYVLNYSLLSLRKIHSGQPVFFAINLCAAACVLIGLLVSFNLASALIQLFWVFISLTAIALRWLRPVGAMPLR